MKVSFSKENVITPTPVPGVNVESVNTAAPVIDVSATVTPAASIPSSPVTALVPAAPATGAVTRTDTPIEFDDNDIRFEDIYLPKVNLVHNVGDLMKVFSPGEIVLNGTYVIHTPTHQSKKGTDPLKITVIGFKKKQYVEKISGGDKGLLVNTEAEVEANGGTLNYAVWKQNVDARKTNPALPAIRRFETLATALLLIERPPHLTDSLQFPYEFEGKFYALALWGMKGTAFTNAAKHFFTARKIGFLKSGYWSRSWALTTKLEDYNNGNVSWIPQVDPCKEANSDSFVAFVKEVIGAGN